MSEPAKDDQKLHRNTKLSLYPLTTEEALKVLLETPPPAKEVENKPEPKRPG